VRHWKSGLVDGALAVEELKRGVVRRSTAKAEPEAGAQKKMSDSNQPQVFVEHFVKANMGRGFFKIYTVSASRNCEDGRLISHSNLCRDKNLRRI
jgi:hypothetical protein